MTRFCGAMLASPAGFDGRLLKTSGFIAAFACLRMAAHVGEKPAAVRGEEAHTVPSGASDPRCECQRLAP
eukprot:3092057-Prymnesium_polylepis.1